MTPFQANGPVFRTPVRLAGKKLTAQKMVREHTQFGRESVALFFRSDRTARASATICNVVHAYCRSMTSQPVSVSSWISAGSRSGRNAAMAQKQQLNDTTATVRAPPMSCRLASVGYEPSIRAIRALIYEHHGM